MSPELRIVSDLAELHRAGADEFTRCAREAISAHDRFAVALAGGLTPKGAYSLIAADQKDPAKRLPWDKIHLFFSDERNVPPDDEESNYRMANESLLSRVSVPQQNVHRIPAELDANTAASQYEAELRNFFKPKPGDWPRFDLIMLGMGPDGHTASLFPGSAALNLDSRWVVENRVEKFKTYRITFTFPVINHAAEVMFLVAGEDKAPVLKEVLQGKEDVYPAQRVRPIDGRLLWVVDKAAAKLL
ncbi:MAG TPA: 6-phosphogluconolactonase [Candidatus Angelobacter sp.]|nr:6-phosphogluconolactonase [Candidatus Angelobacter sp.]